MAQWINLFQNNRFVLYTSITFFVRKIVPVHVAEPGLTAGRQVAGRQAGRQVADEIQLNLEIFKNHCTSKDSTFYFV